MGRELESAMSVVLPMVIGDPPYDVEGDLDGKGYWLKPAAPKEDARRKQLRKQTLASLMLLLAYVDRHRPRIIVGIGQGGLIAALLLPSLPCRCW